MSSPFLSGSTVGQPTWTVGTSNDGNFTPQYSTFLKVTPEIGYGEGGYGEDGYDTPAATILAVPQPTWTTVTDK